MGKFKDSLITKLGGYTVEQYYIMQDDFECVESHANLLEKKLVKLQAEYDVLNNQLFKPQMNSVEFKHGTVKCAEDDRHREQIKCDMCNGTGKSGTT